MSPTPPTCTLAEFLPPGLLSALCLLTYQPPPWGITNHLFFLRVLLFASGPSSATAEPKLATWTPLNRVAHCPVGLFMFRSLGSLGYLMLTVCSLLTFKAPLSREHSQTTRVEPQLCTNWGQTSLSWWIWIILQAQFFICYPSTPVTYSDNSPQQVFRRTAELHCHNDEKGQSTEEQQNLFSWLQFGFKWMAHR